MMEGGRELRDHPPVQLERNMIASFGAFLENDEGAVSIEYVLLAMLIAVVAIGAVTGIGLKLSGEFSEISTMYK